MKQEANGPHRSPKDTISLLYPLQDIYTFNYKMKQEANGPHRSPEDTISLLYPLGEGRGPSLKQT